MLTGTLLSTEQSQGSILRIYGNGDVFVEDICKCLNALDQAYNSAYVLNSIAEQAKEIYDVYGERPPIPLRNLLWISWWPPNAEKLKALVPDKDRLKLLRVELQSPGFADFKGMTEVLVFLTSAINFYKTILDLKIREQEWKDKKRESEDKKRESENISREYNLLFEKMRNPLQKGGATEKDLALVQNQLMDNSMKPLKEYQDQGIITGAEIIDDSKLDE